MADDQQAEQQDEQAGQAKPIRQRKSHTKSRKGCRGCKLRRVKCDETRPQCRKCINYGVQCNYSNDGGDELQLRTEGAMVFTSVPHSMGPGLGPNVPKDSMSPEGDDGELDKLLDTPLTLHSTKELYRLTREDIDVLRMFYNRTVFTIGTSQSVETYQTEIVALMFNSSYLVHVIMALTLMHDRHINSTIMSDPGPSQKESFHLYHGTGMFNDMISSSIEEKEKDAMWAAAALLGAVTIASIDATSPEEAWPLRRDALNDLDWLRMSDGKKEIWRLVDPLRETSVWRKVMSYQGQQDPEPYSFRVPELDMLYPFLTKIYDFNPMVQKPEDEKDPYHTAASILTRLLELDCNHSTIMYFLSFLGHMDSRFRQLLHRKDPKALLLLAWWYGKMCQYNVWWQRRRMVLEGQAICLYLERYHSDQKDLVKLLNYPKVMTGLIKN